MGDHFPGLVESEALAGQRKPLQRDRSGHLCQRPGCGKALRGRQQAWCSETCRWKVWDAAHPRLDFDQPERTKPAPATGEPYESARLWLLARLQQGPVCPLELRREPWPASLNPAQRVLELRNRQYRIKTERVEGKTYYRLEE